MLNLPKVGKIAPFVVRVGYDAAQNKDTDLYSELRGKEIFRDARGTAMTDGHEFSDVKALWADCNIAMLKHNATSAHPRTKQVIWPNELLKISDDLSSIEEDQFNVSFRDVSANASLDTQIAIVIAPEYSMVTRSFLDALLMLSCGNILNDYILKSNDDDWLNTGTATQILRDRIRVVYYNSSKISDTRQYVKLGHYLDTALLRMSDRFCRALSRKDDHFLSKFNTAVDVEFSTNLN